MSFGPKIGMIPHWIGCGELIMEKSSFYRVLQGVWDFRLLWCDFHNFKQGHIKSHCMGLGKNKLEYCNAYGRPKLWGWRGRSDTGLGALGEGKGEGAIWG